MPPSQADLHKRMKASPDPDTRRGLALDLLAATRSRQMIDDALRVLDKLELNAEDCPILRDKLRYYIDHTGKDSGALIREQLIRLLGRIGDPADTHLFVLGARTYDRKPVSDTAQTCRAAALVALAGVDRTLACVHAARLLGEPDTSPQSGEPAITAISVLARFNEPLPVYAFILRQGMDFARGGMGEVVGRALELLGADFPPEEYADALAPILELDVPAATAGAINHIVNGRVAVLYPLLERILDETGNADLHYYGLVTLAAARDDTLTERLYACAKTCTPAQARDYLEAVELTAHRDREDVIAMLQKRLR
jgi:hypothetical protein